jgi:protein SCO1/2
LSGTEKDPKSESDSQDPKASEEKLKGGRAKRSGAIAKGPLIALMAAGIVSCAVFVFVLLQIDSSKSEADTTPTASGLRGNKIPHQLVKEPAPRINLTDANGKEIDTDRLKGRPYLVTFLYTQCPDVCPVLAIEIQRALKKLGPKAGAVDVLAVSVDPKGDSPEAARRWLKHQKLPANVYYLLGTKEQLAKTWRGYFVSPQTPDRPQTSNHTASVWLIDGKGHRRTSFSGGAPIDPADLAHDLGALVSEVSKEGSR